MFPEAKEKTSTPDKKPEDDQSVHGNDATAPKVNDEQAEWEAQIRQIQASLEDELCH